MNRETACSHTATRCRTWRFRPAVSSRCESHSWLCSWTRERSRTFWPRTAHADYSQSAGADRSEELGQGIRVSFQVRRLFLLHASANGSEMGHIDSDHDPGQGVRAVTLRAYGIYSYRIVDPRAFFTQVSGTRDSYYAPELEGQLRNTIVARMTNSLANSNVSFLDMASTQTKM